MAQHEAWEREYRHSKLLTKDDEPQKDILRFIKFLRKEQKASINDLKVLDLGSGTGRNANHFASLGCDVIGLEISETAVGIARGRAGEKKLGKVKYFEHDIGSAYPIPDASMDIVLDVTSSNSLLGSEREIYLRETHRVLKPNGWFFIKALCKDGDANAKALLKKSPGPEADTYFMEDLSLIERVWTKKDFEEFYGRMFEIVNFEKKESYTRMNNRSYKRSFWIGYLKKV